MEFNEKLQQLRKQKNITQEETAELLFVSRTAISKWESGRGYPSIDSLKSISKLFSVSIDELLSGEEIILLAEDEQKEKAKTLCSLLFGTLDCMTALLFFLPFFGQQESDIVKNVPLLSLANTGNYKWIIYIYIAVATIITVFGVVQFALQNCQKRLWVNNNKLISIILSSFLTVFAILNRQPYVGVFLLCLLIMKGVLLIKRQ